MFQMRFGARSASSDPAPRYAVLLSALLQWRNQNNSVRICIRNISESGFLADCPKYLSRREYIIVTVRGYDPIEANVVWWKDGRVGVEFKRPVDIAPLLHPQAERRDRFVPRVEQRAWRPMIKPILR